MKNGKHLLSLSGKVAWITGASSGIGEQLAHQFAAQGASLILSARHLKRLELVKSKLQQFQVTVQLLPLDLERLDQLPAKAEKALSFFGKVDYMVHNAGVGLRDFALDTDLATDQKIMNINYFGPMVITKAIVPEMLRRGSGHLVIMSSLSGKYGVPRTSSYAASKHAIEGFYETLRSEIAGSGVNITMIVPGIIQTQITAHALDGAGKLFGRLEKTFQSAYPVEKAASEIMAAVLKNKEAVFVGGMEGVTLLLNRISPWFLRRLIRSHPIKKWRVIKRKLFPGKRQCV